MLFVYHLQIFLEEFFEVFLKSLTVNTDKIDFFFAKWIFYLNFARFSKKRLARFAAFFGIKKADSRPCRTIKPARSVGINRL